MTRLSRSRTICAAMAAAAAIAAAGCADHARLTAGSSRSHIGNGAESPNLQHSPSPATTRTTLAPKPPSAAPASTGTEPTNPATLSPTGPAVCTTSDANGECGPYSDPQIEGLGSGNQDNLQVGNNMWNPISGASSTLYASSPADWHVVANMPAGNTDVVSYPSLGVDFHLQNSSGNWYEQPLTNFKSMISSFSENMHATRGTSAWAAYDIWLNGGKNEVMIQHDFADNGACTSAATANFGGSNGVPVQTWHLCRFGSEQVWKLGTNDDSKINEQSGSVDIKSMLTWMENHGDLPQGTTIGLLGYGWEIASTGGANEDFQVNLFTLTTS